MGFVEDENFKFPDEITDDDCFFSNKMLDNVYRSILFREGDEYSSELARKDFKLPQTIDGDYEFKEKLKKLTENEKQSIEDVYTKLKKLFMLKKYYLVAPTQVIQQEIVKIRKYEKNRYK